MSDHKNRALYVISVVAELAGVHPQTLRMYERKGLIEPKRTAGNSRRYSDEDVELLRRIQELTDAGVNLAGVQAILRLEAHVERLQDQVRRLNRRLAEAERDRRRHPGVLVRLSDVRNVFERR